MPANQHNANNMEIARHGYWRSASNLPLQASIGQGTVYGLIPAGGDTGVSATLAANPELAALTSG